MKKSNLKILKLNSLKNKFTIPVLIAVAVLLIISNSVRFILDMNISKADIEEKANTTVALAALSLSNPLWNYNTEGTKAIGEALFKDKEVAYVEVQNSLGFVVYKRSLAGISNTSNLITKDCIVLKDNQKTGTLKISLTNSYRAKSLIDNAIKDIVQIVILLVVLMIIITIVSHIVTKPLTKLNHIIERLTNGDLSVKIDIKSKDEIGNLAGYFENFVEKLRSKFISIRNSAETVSKATNEIASGNDNLSQRTQEEAASIQETSSAIEELTATVKQNAQNAQRVNVLTNQTVEVVKVGDQVIKQTINAMEEVNSSSKKIAEIINVVNDIAFQTNLLALNAAVEAARAGEQGKGFAVVAVEVRNLAQRSAEAAQEIQTLIKDSVDKVKNGNQLVLKAGTNLDKITESITNVSSLISEISTASQEQSLGIEEVNKAIIEMEQITQQNASLVEEAAASSQILNDEVVQLYSVVSEFVLDNNKKQDK